MAGLENLVRSIYHERQQPGSMLCAQHALNSLLQGNYFTAPDLSDIARNLDTLEHSYDESHTESTNMDDSGFFSVQVLENALKVWGLNLTRWRGEEMRPYHDHPHTQLAFILNLDQHWFTLRRFGHAEAQINSDNGDGHWFNLNSFFPEPEWVSKLYLGMVLQQAEAEGYSVFAVTQADLLAPLALPRTDADVIASTLPEPTSATRTDFQSSHKPPSLPVSSMPDGSKAIGGLDDEDYELQAALQASLMGSGYDPDHGNRSPPRLTRSFAPLPPDDSESPIHSTPRPDTGTHTPTNFEPSLLQPLVPRVEGGEQLDPVAASTERNRRMLERMRAEQEYAQRELWEEGMSGPDAASLEARRAEWMRAEEEEAEQLRRAIAESEALARAEGHAPRDEQDGSRDTAERRGPSAQGPPVGHALNDRVYDDDDAALQAALRASLEQVPHGWELPGLPPQRAPIRHPSPPPPPPHAPARSECDKDAEDADSVLSDEAGEHPSSDAAPETVSVDELRRRRLARFGG
ncbi:putative josephin [Lyophyllum shimeji]|uniref:ubiquitinyl hydrolase 1 n=1 Tax=Lyophyllum shimeji TaxID=47721 RepID=A0A9P3PK74_LYOSH|nr:putative josephin [Lyophyllum shimeji]